jgi:hypothetical protein
MFTPQMSRAKRKRLANYGLLAQRYVENFEEKWILRDPTPSDELLGAPDIQSPTWATVMVSCVKYARCHSVSRTSPDWPQLLRLLSCLSC